MHSLEWLEYGYVMGSNVVTRQRVNNAVAIDSNSCFGTLFLDAQLWQIMSYLSFLNVTASVDFRLRVPNRPAASLPRVQSLVICMDWFYEKVFNEQVELSELNSIFSKKRCFIFYKINLTTKFRDCWKLMNPQILVPKST